LKDKQYNKKRSNYCEKFTSIGCEKTPGFLTGFNMGINLVNAFTD